MSTSFEEIRQSWSRACAGRYPGCWHPRRSGIQHLIGTLFGGDRSECHFLLCGYVRPKAWCSTLHPYWLYRQSMMLVIPEIVIYLSFLVPP